ncbi:hypothetical protein [Pseudochelatococcus contaminans]|uniref:PAS domain-containing protein n=1 Tax=Pseudochelatococcus contaminans TaxID=1538103 RepID=A0A7W5Z671_9HYPH|nr:hypothetical protein [Pseudochelatococcus contaminans]MBB3810749.1 PAS domain-containing protein [Pseudochelatococcus contaminans]
MFPPIEFNPQSPNRQTLDVEEAGCTSSEQLNAAVTEVEQQGQAIVRDGVDDLLIDVIGADGRMLWANGNQNARLGLSSDAVDGLPFESLYAPQSVSAIESWLRGLDGGKPIPTSELTLVGRRGRLIATIARPRYVKWFGNDALALVKMDYGSVGLRHATVEDDVRLLSNIVEHSTEAHWAIVFLEPVNVTLPREEIIRQIFENQSVWRMCNKAMAKLYHLPDDMDLNAQGVRLYWPRSAANERFVAQIIDSGYHIDNALSVDLSHDRKHFYMRNDVRADIVDGFLLRLWGNGRDVTGLEFEGSIHLIQRMVEALPMGVIVLDERGNSVARSEAFVHAGEKAEALERRLAEQLRNGETHVGWQALPAEEALTLPPIHLAKVNDDIGTVWTIVTVPTWTASTHPQRTDAP